MSKESIFTGSNNFDVNSIVDVEHDEHFGFTEAEVQELMAIWIIVTIYVAQITFSFLASTSVGAVIVYNNLWFTYIFPLFRLGDFLTGCCMGYIFLQDIGQNVSLSKATIIEVLAFIMMAVTYLIGLYSDLPECMLSVIYIPASAIVVYAIALNSGLISGVLSKKFFVEIGNISAYTFLIHQVIINLMEMIGFHRLNIVVGGFVISIILAYGYRFILNGKAGNFPSKMGESSIPIAWQKNSAKRKCDQNTQGKAEDAGEINVRQGR